MRDSLKGRSVDVAHFLCHAYLSQDRGALAFAESPLLNKDTRMARFVGAAELKAFLTQIGAWSTVFSSPENNHSEMGLRQLCVTLAEMRPGPIVHHELNMDPQMDALASTYKFLYSSTPQPPPATPALFVYCQPFRVLSTESSTAGSVMPNLITRPLQELDAIYHSTENVPAWVAATERYVEECEVRIQKLQTTAGTSMSSIEPIRQRTAETLESTLQKIRGVVARAARSMPSGSSQ